MAATSGIRPLAPRTTELMWRRSSTARLRNRVRDLERMGHVLFLVLAGAAMLLLARFGVNGLVLSPAGTWGIGIVSATNDIVAPFYHLFGSHPLVDLAAAVILGTAAQLLRMLLTGARMPRLSMPTLWVPGSELVSGL